MYDNQFTSDPMRRPGNGVRDVVRQQTADAEGREDNETPGLERLARDTSLTFRRVWEQYRRQLYRCCLRWMGGDPHEANEALSRVAFKVLHILPCHVDTITNHKAWLLRLTYNLCMDMRRGRKRYANKVAHIEDYGGISSDAVARESDHPERFLLRQELREQLQRALAHLPLGLRAPLLLRIVEGLSYREIAARVALTPANARKRVQQARTFMRAELHAYLSTANEDDLKFTN